MQHFAQNEEKPRRRKKKQVKGGSMQNSTCIPKKEIAFKFVYKHRKRERRKREVKNLIRIRDLFDYFFLLKWCVFIIFYIKQTHEKYLGKHKRGDRKCVLLSLN